MKQSIVWQFFLRYFDSYSLNLSSFTWQKNAKLFPTKTWPSVLHLNAVQLRQQEYCLFYFILGIVNAFHLYPYKKGQ